MSEGKLVFGASATGKKGDFGGLLRSSVDEAGQYDSLAPAADSGKRDSELDVDSHSRAKHKLEKQKAESKWTAIGRAPPMTVDDGSFSEHSRNKRGVSDKSRLLDETRSVSGPTSFDLASDVSFRNDFLRKTPTDFKYGVLPALFFGDETSGYHTSSNIYKVSVTVVVTAALLTNISYASYSWMTMFYFDDNYIHPLQLLLFRYITQLLICLIFAYVKYRIREGLPSFVECVRNDWFSVPQNRNRVRIVTQRTLYVVASASFFYSLRILPLAQSILFTTVLSALMKPLCDLTKFLKERGSESLSKVKHFHESRMRRMIDNTRGSQSESMASQMANSMDEFARADANVILTTTPEFWLISVVSVLCLWLVIRMPFNPLFSGMDLSENDSVRSLRQKNEINELDGSRKKYWVGTCYLACVISSMCLCLAFSILRADRDGSPTLSAPSQSGKESISVNLRREYALNARRRAEFPLYMDLMIDSVIGLVMLLVYFTIESGDWSSVTASNDGLVLLKWLLIVLVLPVTMTVSQVLMGFGSAQLESGMVSLIRTTDILMALLITLGIFTIHLSWPTIGASLLCWVACLALSLKQVRIVQLQLLISPSYADIGQRQAVLDDTSSQLL